MPTSVVDHLRFCWSYARPYRAAILLGVLAIAVEAALENLPPLITRALIDDVLTPAAGGARVGWDQAGPLLAGLGATVVGIALAGWAHVQLLYTSSIRVVALLREAVYGHLQSLSLGWHESRSSADLLSRLMEDVDQADDLISRTADELVVAVIGLVAALAIMLWLSWQLTVAALVPVPILLWLIAAFTGRMRPVYRLVRDRKGALYGRAGEALSGVQTVKAFARESHELERFQETHRLFYEARLQSVTAWGRWMPAIHLARNSGLIFVLVWGTRALLTPGSGLTLGVLVAFVMYVQFFYQPFSELFGLYDRVLRASSSMERVREVLAARPDVVDAPAAHALGRLRGAVDFEDVSFRYRTGEEVLRGVTLRIGAGETVALVGSSGAGKTSLVSLVARFYDPTSGVVRVDGHDLRGVTQASLRGQMGFVSQETFLFNDTVYENIRYGRPSATDADIERAARLARAHDFVEKMAEGYQTTIGDRGVRLSSGQRQRLSLARALLADPRILILDEPTSMLDAESEQRIEEAMNEVRVGRTTLIIAHRLTTVHRADRILVVENGQIVEAGTHDQLIERRGRYQELYALQFREVAQVVDL